MNNEFYPLFYSFNFYVFGLIALAGAITFVTRKSPVAAAMWLVVTMFALSALYVMLGAEFIGAMQVLVYAGAIMVVFLFVVMLLNLGHPSEIADIRGKGGRIAAALMGIVLLAQVMALSRNNFDLRLTVSPVPPMAAQTGGVIGSVAGPLFTEYLLAFELTSVLLLAAIIGAVVMAKKKAP